MNLPSPRDLIHRHRLSANHALGQHYLLDPAINRKIAEAAGTDAKTALIETGPGPGSLTCALLEAGAAHIWAIERDRRFLAPLGEIAAKAGGRLEVIHGDALAVDITPIAGQARAQKQRLHLTGNLPYQAAAPLLLRWLAGAAQHEIRAITVLIQEEMAQRLTAAPGGRIYGRFSVMCRFYAAAELLFHVPAEAFSPLPKVAGRLVRLTPHKSPYPTALAPWLEKACAAGFGQRRKMLRVSLRQLAADGEALAREAGLDPEARAERIDLAGWLALARILSLRAEIPPF